MTTLDDVRAALRQLTNPEPYIVRLRLSQALWDTIDSVTPRDDAIDPDRVTQSDDTSPCG